MARHGETARLTGWGRSARAILERRAPSGRLTETTFLPLPGITIASPIEETWFAAHAEPARILSLGFRLELGGAHLARTMMLLELGRVLTAAPHPSPAEVNALVLDQNILQKRTASGRRLSLRYLGKLYGLGAPVPIMRAMVALWPKAGDGQPLLALLAALSREVLLRDTAEIILPAPLSASTRSRPGTPPSEHGYGAGPRAAFIAHGARRRGRGGEVHGARRGNGSPPMLPSLWSSGVETNCSMPSRPML
jgi:hypothetical protein